MACHQNQNIDSTSGCFRIFQKIKMRLVKGNDPNRTFSNNSRRDLRNENFSLRCRLGDHMLEIQTLKTKIRQVCAAYPELAAECWGNDPEDISTSPIINFADGEDMSVDVMTSDTESPRLSQNEVVDSGSSSGGTSIVEKSIEQAYNLCELFCKILLTAVVVLMALLSLGFS